jgi:hypothetical protein
MANVINCPTCSRALRVPDELLGESVQCPSCQHAFTAALPSAPRPQAPSRSAPRDDRDDRPPPRRYDEDDDLPRRRRRRYDEDDDDFDLRRSRRRLAPHRGDTIQLLGILSFFIAGIILGPMAWVMGSNDLKEMDAGRMDPAGRSATSTGRLCGMISTFLHIGGMVISFGILVLYFGFCCCMAGGAGAAGGGGPPPGRRY